jgi:hypothetical protein
MTSKYGPPAQPDTVDQLPPTGPPRLAVPALALGAFGLGTNEFAAMGHMISAYALRATGTPLVPRPVRHWPQEGFSS